jgi:PAS domain S-box-containing protein
MSIDPISAGEKIFTDDLTYKSPDGRYSFKFTYLGDGIFFLVSSGHLDEKSLKEQVLSGNVARQRLKDSNPNKTYHLAWDVSEVKGVSLFARHLIFTRMKSFASYGSISIIGANAMAMSFAKILSKMVPDIKFYFSHTTDEALKNLQHKHSNLLIPSIENNTLSNSKSYAHFIEIWEKQPEYLDLDGKRYKTVSPDEWHYTSPDKTYSIKINLIEGNIVYHQCEGNARPSGVDASYHILKEIMDEFGFNDTDNKFYSIINVKKLKWMTLSGRKRTLYYEQLYRNRAFLVIMVPSPMLQFLFKIVYKISYNEISHWTSTASFEEAFSKVLAHKQGSLASPKLKEPLDLEDKLVIPNSRSEMLQLILKQHQELQNLKNHQHDQIHKIIEVTGRMTWDESFVPPDLEPDSQSPFTEVFNSISLLFQDFKEIIQEKSIHAERLLESEDKYRNLINLANDLIIVYQHDRIKFVNSKLTPMMGYDHSEVLEQSMDVFVAPAELSVLQEYYHKRLSGNKLPSVYETIFVHKNGNLVPVSMSVGTIRYENKPAAMIISRDITQKKRNEAELERYHNHLEDIIKKRTHQLQKEITERKIAEASDQLKTAFLSNMSHEIRTPMNAIISFSNFLKNNMLPEKQREEYLEYIISSGQSLLNLINDIVDISKIEAKQLRIQETSCQVMDVLDELYKFFAETLKDKTNVALKLTIPEKDENALLHTDPYRLKQILSNLLDNAIKFTDSGYIEFGCQITGNNITFFVKDTGIGIPDDQRDLIFRRFGKLETPHRNQGGTGLGLAISMQLANLLSGSLWVESVNGNGSTFYLKLPYNNEREQTTTSSAAFKKTKGEHNWTNKIILIAEDEELNFKVLQIGLRKTGATFVRAFNGKEAVDYVANNSPVDIILMDIQMPLMDGYEAMNIIKTLKPSIPIIAQTAFALLEEQRLCMDKGFNDYVSKPIRMDDLMAKIETLLKK